MDILNRRFLATSVICECDGKLWISCAGFNGLYSYDLKKNKTEFIASFDGSSNDVWKLHGKCIEVDAKLYFLPDRSTCIHCYDIATNKMERIELNEKGRLCSYYGLEKDKKIYFVCNTDEKKLIILDTNTKAFRKIVFPVEYKNIVLATEFIMLNDYLYFADKTDGQLISYSIKNNIFESKRIYKGGGFGTIGASEGNIFLTSETSVLKWNLETEELVEYLYPDGIEMSVYVNKQFVHYSGFKKWDIEHEKPFEYSYIAGGKLMLFPYRTNSILLFDLDTMKARYWKIDDEEENLLRLTNVDRISHKHYYLSKSNDGIIFVSTASKKIYRKCKANEFNLETYSVWADEPENLREYIEGTDIRTEGRDGTLENFINSFL